MGKYRGIIKSMIQGMSQQPARDRLDGQGADQINCHSSPSYGLMRRASSDVLYEFPFVVNTNAAVHTYYRGDTEAYKMVVVDGKVRVIDHLEGVEKTVLGGESAYLDCDSPESCLSFHTVGDVTFVANSHIRVEEGTETSAGRKGECIIFVKHGNYGSTYNVTVDTVGAQFSTPDGSDSSHRLQIATAYIAGQLETVLRANLDAAKYTITRYDYAIHVEKQDGTELGFAYSDDNGGTDMIVLGRTTSKFANLPPQGPIGYVVQLTGTDQDRKLGYWLKYEGEGEWKECLAPGLILGANPDTMPHLLVRNPDGNFAFGPAKEGQFEHYPEAVWVNRRVGDNNTNPLRSFIGYGIEDIGSFQNRLVLLADENFICSRTGGWFDLYRETASEEVDDDPIDIASSENEVTKLKAMVPFNKALVLFSDRSQFVVDGVKPVTTKNVALPISSSYEADLLAAPVAAGAAVFFATNSGQFTNLREYFVEFNTEANKADPISAHVPELVKGRPRKLVASTNFDVLVVLSQEDKNIAYVYEYLWNSDKKVVAAWSKWHFGSDASIVDCYIRDARAEFLVTKGSSSVFLRLDLSHPNPVGLPYAVCLDYTTRVHTVAEPDGTIVFDYPLTYLTEEEVVAVYGDQIALSEPYYTGLRAPIYRRDDGKWVVMNEDKEGYLLVGRAIESKYVLTMPRVKDSSGNTVEGKRLTVQTMSFAYADTGEFNVTITRAGRTTTRTFHGNQLGTKSSRLGVPNLLTGNYTVPIRSRVDAVTVAIESSSYLPMKLLHVEWDGQFSR